MIVGRWSHLAVCGRVQDAHATGLTMATRRSNHCDKKLLLTGLTSVIGSASPSKLPTTYLNQSQYEQLRHSSSISLRCMVYAGRAQRAQVRHRRARAGTVCVSVCGGGLGWGGRHDVLACFGPVRVGHVALDGEEDEREESGDEYDTKGDDHEHHDEVA